MRTRTRTRTFTCPCIRTDTLTHLHAAARSIALVAAAAACLVVTGCASTVRTAIAQSATVKGAPMSFGGSYDSRPQELTVTINGEPVMRGTFPPYTPTMTLNANYRGSPVRAECYFASNVSSPRGGFVGRVVGTQVQAAQGKAGDECKMNVDGVDVTSIYF